MTTARSPPSTPAEAEKTVQVRCEGHPILGGGVAAVGGGRGVLMVGVCGFLLTEGAPWFQRGHRGPPCHPSKPQCGAITGHGRGGVFFLRGGREGADKEEGEVEGEEERR